MYVLACYVLYILYCVSRTSCVLFKILRWVHFENKNGGFRVAIELHAVMQFIANDADRESFDLLNLRLD